MAGGVDSLLLRGCRDNGDWSGCLRQVGWDEAQIRNDLARGDPGSRDLRVGVTVVANDWSELMGIASRLERLGARVGDPGIPEDCFGGEVQMWPA